VRTRARKVVVALLDGGADDARVVDAALAACVARGRGLRLVHLYGSVDEAPTPWVGAGAKEYGHGALAVAHLVPGVEASVLSLPWGQSAKLRPELAHAEILVSSRDVARQVVAANRPPSAAVLLCRLVTVGGDGDAGGARGAGAGSDGLRLGYRLALQNELDRSGVRDDGATTPAELDMAWRVGVACPELSAEAVRAWHTCSAWPPRSVRSPSR